MPVEHLVAGSFLIEACGLGVVIMARYGARRAYERLEQAAAEFAADMTSEKLAVDLLGCAERDYAIHEGHPPRCDFARKRIFLANPDSRTFRACYEAAHEVGHAVAGPGWWGMRRRLWWLLFGLCGAVCAVAGFAGWRWLSVVAVPFIVSTVADGYLREARACRWAAEMLAGRPVWVPVRGLVERWARVCRLFVFVEELAWATFFAGGMALCYGVGVSLREFLEVI